MNKLAFLGGEKTRKNYFPKQNNIGEEEKNACLKVLDSGFLSGYRGNWSEQFFGGERVGILSKKFSEKFNIHHTIPCNSCTSGLHIACRAIGLKPEDEVIVTPWSMSCSASAPCLWGATPVFADIEKDYFCLDPASIKEKITNKTKAIIVVDLFGLPYDKKAINEIAEENNLYIIEDAAQAIGAIYENDYTGSLGHIGVFSFTQGKILFSGEGGIITTNDSNLAFNCRLLMNHAESVINDLSENFIKQRNINTNLFGFNMRMTEMQAAIIIEQLNKLDFFLESRKINVNKLEQIFKQIPAIEITSIRKNCTHSYYVHPLKWNSEKADGIHRDLFVKAVLAELMPEDGRLDKALLGCGYIKPLYKMPFFKTLKEVELPVVNNLWANEFIVDMFHGLPLQEEDFHDIEKALMKVWENKSELKLI